MGSWHLFECGSCGYRAEVSGGDDAGMLVSTTTVFCEACTELYDVVTENRSWKAGGPIEGPQEPRCPKSKKHPIRLWTYPGPCPRCGECIEDRGSVALWD
ncbi:MAG: hypothetical protein CYG60_24855 [Actinobacteria bacterium]|nr:MAG: hypothetical protein CYG60_24855 [Actinomycetota bacterium]